MTLVIFNIENYRTVKLDSNPVEVQTIADIKKSYLIIFFSLTDEEDIAEINQDVTMGLTTSSRVFIARITAYQNS